MVNLCINTLDSYDEARRYNAMLIEARAREFEVLFKLTGEALVEQADTIYGDVAA